ncbi:hypothetical protein MP228_001710 [Amoeboaphelidium protococcarum]|nr:hypothetical protein MP228_001710 [Amoeboaphelidium protococcarum]
MRSQRTMVRYMIWALIALITVFIIFFADVVCNKKRVFTINGGSKNGNLKCLQDWKYGSNPSHQLSPDSYLTKQESLEYPCLIGSHSTQLDTISKSKLMYIVMTGSLAEERQVAVAETWAGRTMDSVYFVSDRANSSLNVLTFQELVNKTGYADAQHRQFSLLRRLATNHVGNYQDDHVYYKAKRRWTRSDWVILVDDDTWVNTENLGQFLSRYNCQVPMAFGYVFPKYLSEDIRPLIRQCYKYRKGDCETRFHYDDSINHSLGWLSGGGGMILSKPAAELIGKALYTVCPFDRVNDLTMGQCLSRLQIPTIHLNELMFSGTRAFESWSTLNYAVIQSALTIHYVPKIKMYQVDECYNGRSCFKV